VLKTNSVQGVLVFGSKEKRLSWEVEELIATLNSSVVENTGSGLKVSQTGQRGVLGLG
jgi:hypothetical protein